MRFLLLALTALSSVTFAGTKFVGGGLESGPTAPIFLPVADSAMSPAPKVMVSQLLYTQVELGFPANTRIIDVAWRKEGLGPMTDAAGCAEQVYLKNVTAQMGPFTVGSTQTLTDALQGAQKVIDRTGRALPSTMGFVTLDAIENQFVFIYGGDGLEVTIVTDCSGAATPIATGPISWRYDTVPDRVRVASGGSTTGLVLTAEPVLSSFRPHTRFRTLSETPRIEIRVAGNVLPNGGTFGVAMNHFAAGLVAPFAFELYNDSKDPVTVTDVTTSGVNNGTAMVNATLPATVMPGQAFPTPLDFTPTTAGVLSRLSVTWTTSAGNQTNTFQGTPTATPTPQPSGALEKPDGTLQPLTRPATTTVDLGNVPPGHQAQQTLVAQNFGQGSVPAQVDVVSGDVPVVPAPVMVGTQQDVRLVSVVRAPMVPGNFTTETRLTVGSLTYVVRTQGVVTAPELAVSVEGVDIPNGFQETITRPSGAQPFLRTYVLANLGNAPLYFQPQLTRVDAAMNTAAPPAPRVLAPMSFRSVVFDFPQLAPGTEPFSFFTVTNDADETYFRWTTVTRLPPAGKPSLAVSVSVRGAMTRGEALFDVFPESSNVTQFQNVGDAPLTITEFGERCANCDEARRPALVVPVTLQPQETVSRELFFARDAWRFEYAVQSDDPDGVFAFSVEKKVKSSCESAPVDVLLLLGLGLWRRRRPRRD